MSEAPERIWAWPDSVEDGFMAASEIGNPPSSEYESGYTVYVREDLARAAPTVKPMECREDLARIEHEQWAHWTRYMLDNMTPENIERWRRQIGTDYDDLSEHEKDADRTWADKVLSALK